jgi:hypothetical protein
LEVNDQYIKVAKIKGQDLPWHNHEQEDELFYIVAGNLLMEIENELPFTMKKVILCKKRNESSVSAAEECAIMLIESNRTYRKGKISNQKTIEDQSISLLFYDKKRKRKRLHFKYKMKPFLGYYLFAKCCCIYS